MKFEVKTKSGKARTGILETSHGIVRTPAFMPVGTQGTVKAISPRELSECGTQIVLANAYHLYLKPGHELVREIGGLHRFMGWDRPILTDSGGYQVFSLSDLNRIDDDGVIFQSHFDGSRHQFTPSKVVEIQAALGSDIAMVLDDCPGYPCTRDRTEDSVRRTSLWAASSREAFAMLKKEEITNPGQALFGITQGGIYADLRSESALRLLELDFDGYAVGGLSVGEPKDTMLEIMKRAIQDLPEGKPRYVMGIGYPADIIEAVACGADLFDCVVPTRLGRNGTVFTAGGRLQIRNSEFSGQDTPIEAECSCEACRNFSRAYIRHLHNVGEILGVRLTTLHNISYFARLMSQIREAIESSGLEKLQAKFYNFYDDTREKNQGI
ncbi:MAG: tRNA guanosine(34) transglycosylase Tgt [Candidatus Glassbacteria bacterium]